MAIIYQWTTSSGNRVNLDDMSEGHLRNILKMLMRQDRILPKRDNECDATEVDIY
jgi:hypothetical protein